MSSSWFSVGRVISGLWRKQVNSVSDNDTISDLEQTDNISNNDITDDNGNFDDDNDDSLNDDDDDDDEEVDDDEWHDRELTPTKYRELDNTDGSKVYFANETVCESTSYGSLTSSLAAEVQPELTKAAVLLGSTPVIWRPQVTVYQVCSPIVQPTVTQITTIATTCTSAECDPNWPAELCDSPSVNYATSSSGSETDFDDFNSQENWQCYPPITSSIPPPLPPPDWPEAETQQRLNTLRKRIGPEMRKVWGSVHQLANGPAAHKIKSRWKKLKKSTTTSSSSQWGLQGQSGFEDLRRYIKQGGDFCKELATILQERSEAESQYSKTLAKLSSKLVKATKEGSGTVNSAWHRIALEMDVQADIHRHFASALCEEVVKPLKQLLESQHRTRKYVETAVDKSGKNLAEWRATESKAKKNSFTCARENEKLREPNSENRNSRLSASSLHIHKQGTDKETKLESKRRKAEECVKKADVEYYTVCLRAERSRLEWESAIVRGSHCFQVLEEERLRGLKDLATSYVQNHNNLGPKFTQMSSRIVEPLENCEIEKDLEIVTTLRTATEPSQEQMLPDFYPEHTALAMNRDRRKQALINLLQLIRADLERERRGKVGVENLARALKQTPTFASEDSQQNVHDKLHHMRSMLTYLEAARYKVQSALAELEGGPPVSHPLAGHIHVTRDRQGYQQSVLKVPPWVHNETHDLSSEYSDWVDRGTADGTSVQPDSDFDEFSSQGSEKDYETSVIKVPEASPQRCKALYNYTANLYDELTLNPGDIINIHDKQPDGWWLGELNGVVGIFPATYVEEIK